MISYKNIVFSLTLLLSIAQVCNAEDVFATPTAENTESIQVTIKITRDDDGGNWDKVVSSCYDLAKNLAESEVNPVHHLDTINKTLKEAIKNGTHGEIKIEFEEKN